MSKKILLCSSLFLIFLSSSAYAGVDADFAMFSLERTKHISSHEGGLLITNNSDYAMKARRNLKNYNNVIILNAHSLKKKKIL